MASDDCTTGLLKAVKRELDDVTKRQDLQPLGHFILKSDIESVWKRTGRLEGLFAPYGYDSLEHAHFFKTIEKYYLKIISILVYIRWTDWRKFEPLFMDKGDRSDEHLPFMNSSELKGE